MKQKNALILKTVLVVLIVEVVLGGMYYLFVYDKNKPIVFAPQLHRIVLEEEIKKIEPLTEGMSGELMINQDDFEGILVYRAGKNTPEEIEETRGHMDSDVGYTHIVFPDDSYEVYAHYVEYRDIINAWQYGWWDRLGNMYADWYGDDAAKGKPNYRYHHRFWLRKNTDAYFMDVFCNTDDAEAVFSACIDSMDKWEPFSDDSED